MGFVGVSRAVYDFQPSGEGELEIKEGDLLFILDSQTGDDWWKAKKKASSDDDDEPEGLVPNNYVEQATPTASAKALYEYSRQTDEELSFAEDATLEVFDTSDPDWTLVGLNGEYGFAPANYLDIADTAAPAKPPRPSVVTPPEPQYGDDDDDDDEPDEPPAQTPAAALAGILQQKTGGGAPPIPTASRPPLRQQLTPEPSDEEEPPPSLPRRPPSEGPASPRSPPPTGIMSSSSRNRSVSAADHRDPSSPGGYHLYNIHEMISHMGKNKKMPTTLGINLGRGVITIAPEKSRDGPQQEWTAEKLTHYSIEGKHVFVELVRPSKSIDFHAGAKDTAEEIVTALGELAGASRGGGLREVIDAASGAGLQKKGRMLFDFMAQGEDEVSVAEHDDLLILDDSKSDEWWMVRRLKNGKEGVVPANYVQVTGIVESAEDPSIAAAKAQAEQNRIDEEARRARERREKDKRKSRAGGSSSESKPKPNVDRVRTWTDRSGSFKVDAEFLGLKEGKIHLHKMNGVQIAVPVSKMSVADLEYVERVTGQSLDEEKPLSDIKRRQSSRQPESRSSRTGAAVERQTPKYDWFEFFLSCGVNPHICDRYAASFDRDQMTEENLPDIQPTLLRTLGLKEGDILRVMKHLDEKYGRERKTEDADGVNGDGHGLFSGPGGALRNNTRKGRPAPAVSNNDTVDPRAFDQAGLRQDRKSSAPSTPSAVTTPPPSTKPARSGRTGFDDDAWDVRPASRAAPASTTASPPPAAQQQQIAAPAPQKPAPTGAMADLSLITPLQPTQATPQPQPQATVSPPQLTQPTQPPAAQPQQTGADHAFFDRVAQAQAPAQPRQRPQPPPQQQSSFLPPPPSRSASAPQNQQQPFGVPPPLQQQLTGMPGTNYGPAVAPPGQSLSEMQNQQRMQQMYMNNMNMMPQQTGYPGFNPGMGQNMSMQPQMNGMYPQQTQGFATGQQTGAGPFADPPRAPFQPQPTGFGPQQQGFGQQNNFGAPQPQVPQPTGVNSFLPPALAPQKTGAGFGGFGPQPDGYAQPQQPLHMQPTGWPQQQQQQNQYNAPPVPPMPQSAPAPLQAQKTGPAPPVKFGVANKLAPQPTGKANLQNATPQNPFGF